MHSIDNAPMCQGLTDLPAQEPEFEAAMVRYYKDVINCMGALQLVPKFMTR